MAINKVWGVMCAAALLALGMGMPCAADSMYFDGTLDPGSSSHAWETLQENNGPPLDFFGGSLAGGPYESIIETDLLTSDLHTWILSPGDIDGKTFIGLHFRDEFGIDDMKYHLTTVPVPEPSSIVFLLAGLGVIGWVAFRRKKASAPVVS